MIVGPDRHRKNGSARNDVNVCAAIEGRFNDDDYVFILESRSTQHLFNYISNCESVHNTDRTYIHLTNYIIVEAGKKTDAGSIRNQKSTDGGKRKFDEESALHV